MFAKRSMRKLILALLILLLLGSFVLAWQQREALTIRRQRAFVSAARQGNLARVRWLFYLGADVNGAIEPPEVKDNPFPAGTDLAVVENAVKEKFSVTPLTAAVANARRSVIEFLLAHGANVNQQGELGTPLTIAVISGQKSEIDLLLAAGADMSLGWKFLEGGQTSPLELAVLAGRLDFIELLLSKGAAAVPNANSALWAAVRRRDAGILSKLLSYGLVPAEKDYGENNLFVYARQQNDPEIIKLLKPFETKIK